MNTDTTVVGATFTSDAVLAFTHPILPELVPALFRRFAILVRQHADQGVLARHILRHEVNDVRHPVFFEQLHSVVGETGVQVGELPSGAVWVPSRTPGL